MTDGISRERLGGQSLLTLCACLFVFIGLSGNGVVTPALNVMKTQMWTDIPASTITLIQTLPSLFAIAGCVVTGALAGRVLSWRATAIFAFVCYLVFGVAPALGMTDFYTVLVCRAGWGFANGLLWPLGNALILRIYKEGTFQQMALGWGQSLQSLGGTILTMLGGFLAAINPLQCFWGYAIALIGLVLVIAGLPKIELEEKPKGEKAQKEKVPARVWLWMLFLFGGIMCVTVPLMASSTIMAERGFGGSAFAGIVSSMYTVGGVVAGLTFGFSWKALKRWMVPVYYLGCAICMVVIYFASSALMLAVGLFCLAFCFIQVRPAIFKILELEVSKGQLAIMIGAATAVFNFGNFATTYFIKFVNGVFFGGVDSMVAPILATIVVYIVLAIAFGVILLVKNKSYKEADAAREG